jgi:cholesterol oxidase
MKGRVAFGESDFERGKRDGDYLMFHLTIEAEDIESFVADPRHEAGAVGWVGCEALGGRRPVERGWFNLFVDTGEPGDKRMLYRLHFTDGVGHPLTLTGYKVIKHDKGFDLWPDTTTLYTRVLSGHVMAEGDETAEVVASGVLRVQKLDFARQLTTFRGSGSSFGRNLGALMKFNVLFVANLREVYAPWLGKKRAR